MRYTGQFVTHADGFKSKIQFKLEKHVKFRPDTITKYSEKGLDDNYYSVLMQGQSILAHYEASIYDVLSVLFSIDKGSL